MTVDVTPESDRPGRRPRRLRRKVATAAVGVTLLSILLLGAFNYFEARALLSEGIENQLAGQGSARAQRIERGLDWIRNTVSVAAAGERIAEGVMQFSEAYERLNATPDLLDETQLAALEDFYERGVLESIEAAGLPPPAVDELLPTTDAGRYLQYHYIVENPFPTEERRTLVAADGDASEYGALHPEAQVNLVDLADSLGFGDLLLTDTAGNVVFTTNKRIDLGRELGAAAAPDDPLALLLRRLASRPPGETVVTDFQLYLPAGGRPVMFAGALVRAETRTVGALVVEIPIESVNRLTTAGGRWEETGLGDTGEVYLVGADRLIRSESRRWIEDRDGYLDAVLDAGHPPELADAMAVLDSAVLLQPVETKPVERALEGEVYTGGAVDYLGRRSLAFAAAIADEELDWVVVAEVAASEAEGPLRSFRNRILLTAAILIPAGALLALALADRMTQPVEPVVRGAAAIAGGDLEPDLPDLGNNEFGDVARQMEKLAAEFRRHEGELAEQEQEMTRLLLATLPPRLVEQVRRGERKLDDLVDTATVVAVGAEGMLEQPGVDPESAVELSARLSASLEDAAASLDIERVRSSSTLHLFVAGLGLDDDTAPDPALTLAMNARQIVDGLAEETATTIRFTAGLASGEVIAGLLSAEQLTYGVFGEPAQLALTLEAAASPGQILVHESTARDLGPDWQLEPAGDLAGLGGEMIRAHLVAVETEATSSGTAVESDGRSNT